MGWINEILQSLRKAFGDSTPSGFDSTKTNDPNARLQDQDLADNENVNPHPTASQTEATVSNSLRSNISDAEGEKENDIETADMWWQEKLRQCVSAALHSKHHSSNASEISEMSERMHQLHDSNEQPRLVHEQLRLAHEAITTLIAESNYADFVEQESIETTQDLPDRSGMSEPASALIDIRQFEQITGALKCIEETIQSRFQESDRLGRIIDRLEEDLRNLKQREKDRRLESVLKGVIILYDDIAGIASNVRVRHESSADVDMKLTQTILVLEKQILELLARNGATNYMAEVGSDFDAKRQEILGTEATTEQELHLKVESAQKLGFEFAGRVLRPASVRVYKYKAQPSSQAR